MSGPDNSDSFFARPKKKWDAAAFARRPALSSLLGRNVRVVRAKAGSAHWKKGNLLVEDANTGELLAVVPATSIHDPHNGWTLRFDC